MTRRLVKPTIEILAVVDNLPRFNLTCSECGSYEQTRRGDGSIMDMVHCAGCNAWHGRLSAITAWAVAKAHADGYEIDRRAAIHDLQTRTAPTPVTKF